MTRNWFTSFAPHTLFVLKVHFDRTRRREWLASDSSALESFVSAACGPGRAALCPNCWRTASTSVNKKIQWRQETYKLYQHIVGHLLPISGSKICDLSSAQTERHSVTNWWSVALAGVMAVSTAKWSKHFNKWGTHKPNSRYPYLNSILPSSKACSSITRFRSWLPTSTGPGSWADNGTRRRVMTACFRLLICLTLASVDTSPVSEKHGPSIAAPGKESSWWMVANLPKYSTLVLQTWRNFHGSTCRNASTLLIGRRAPQNKFGSGTAQNTTFRLFRAIIKLSGRPQH